mmetsp:Transcript_3909/g.5961  ORF Transcript_3909/g.5961 Transcript_3909/m.5961 type:complete len:226 (+) Transcript_3909:150-827(+)
MNTGTKYRYYKCCVTGKDRSMQTSDPEHRLSKRVQSYKGKQCPWELRATLAKGEGQWKIRLLDKHENHDPRWSNSETGISVRRYPTLQVVKDRAKDLAAQKLSANQILKELSGDLIDQDCDLFSLLQTPSSRQQVEQVHCHTMLPQVEAKSCMLIRFTGSQVIRSKSFARYYFRKYGKGLSNLTENDAKYMASLIREANAKNSDIWPYPLTKYQNEPLQVCLELL